MQPPRESILADEKREIRDHLLRQIRPHLIRDDTREIILV